MFRERIGSERESAEKWGNLNFALGKRSVGTSLYFSQLPKQSQLTKHHQQRPQRRPRFDSKLQTVFPQSSEFHGGHRGLSHPPWGCGPREPPYSGLGGSYGGVITLFIDGLSSSATNRDLRKLFGSFGTVVDAFISRKNRKNNKLAFGFVRYKHGAQAEDAILNLDGHPFFGLKIKVSLARFGKDGSPLPQAQHEGSGKPKEYGPFFSPALRVNRRFSGVNLGRINVDSMLVNNDGVAKNKESDMKTQVTLNIHENPAMVSHLNLAIVVDLEKPSDVKKVESLISENDMAVSCISSLSPSKVALFFDDEPSLRLALEEDSPLRRVFTDIRRWSDNELFSERLVWLQCIGVHPKCWGPENFKKIGELWGDTVEVEHEVNGVNSLTSAKILVRTSYMERIDKYVTLSWESGSCTARIFESNICGCRKVLSVDSLVPNESCLDVSNMKYGGVLVGVDKDGDGVTVQEKELFSTVRDDMREDGFEANAVHGVLQLSKCFEGNGEAVGLMMEEIDNQREEGEAVGSEQHFAVCDDLQMHTRKEGYLCSAEPRDESIDKSIEAFELTTQSRVHDGVWFDPILAVEIACQKETLGSNLCSNSLGISSSLPLKRPRGRPKRVNHSFPEPLYVPSTPAKGELEAMETWNTAKLLGVKSSNDRAVISALRKSKRLLVMEEINTSGQLVSLR
ncbi:unnamed protein product [Amaranthus hypochondriacus]